MPSTASNRRLYDLWRVRHLPFDRFPPERVWKREDGRFYYSRSPERETPEAVESHNGKIFWAPAKNGWYLRLLANLRKLGQQNPVCVQAHLPTGPFCFRGSSRCWALAEIGDLSVDAIVSLPRGVLPEDVGLTGKYVEPTHEGLCAEFTDCNNTHFDDREWDARPPQIEIYEQRARKCR